MVIKTSVIKVDRPDGSCLIVTEYTFGMNEGEAVWNFTAMFLQLWNISRPTDEDFAPYRHHFARQISGGGYVLPYGDTPFDPSHIIIDHPDFHALRRLLFQNRQDLIPHRAFPYDKILSF